MEIMTQTNDGFRIAEEDLKLRGPGEFYGTRQSGMPELYIADIVRDIDVLTETRQTAFELVESDPELQKPEYRPLRRALARYRQVFELVSVS
jgi:ATP-dependent DNA helicase RecG